MPPSPILSLSGEHTDYLAIKNKKKIKEVVWGSERSGKDRDRDTDPQETNSLCWYLQMLFLFLKLSRKSSIDIDPQNPFTIHFKQLP